jgi:hypothetical protein
VFFLFEKIIPSTLEFRSHKNGSKSIHSKEVEILIYPYEKNKNTDETKHMKKKSLAKGLLQNYHKPDLLEKEKNAWSEVVEEGLNIV